MSGEELFASGGSLSGLPTSSTNAMQTLEKLLSALPQSQIVFNSPIKEVIPSLRSESLCYHFVSGQRGVLRSQQPPPEWPQHQHAGG